VVSVGEPAVNADVDATMDATRTEIRRAQVADAAEMARLAGELGYPMSNAEMTRRLAVLLPNERHYVVVAARGERMRRAPKAL
jgi:hypothetical protein